MASASSRLALVTMVSATSDDTDSAFAIILSMSKAPSQPSVAFPMHAAMKSSTEPS